MASSSNSAGSPDGNEKLELPFGYYFYPSDDQVIEYLKKKILGEELPADIIPTINVYSYSSPDQLPLDTFRYGVNGEWFFFTTRLAAGDYLSTRDGFWNPAGLPDEIDDAEVLNLSQERRIIGFKQTLDFYWGPNGTKSNWTIYEYRLNGDQVVVGQIDETIKVQIKSFVACRVRNHDKFRPAGGVIEESESSTVGR